MIIFAIFNEPTTQSNLRGRFFADKTIKVINGN